MTSVMRRRRRAAALAAALAVTASGASAQQAPAHAASCPCPLPERAVQRDIAVYPDVRRALARGTRDSSGAPGPHYFQQRVDYAIEARLDTDAGTLHGSERIVLHNTTPDTLRAVVLRLYQNYFRATSQRNDYVTDITAGDVLERLAVNGAPIALGDSSAYRVHGTVALVRPPAPIMPGADATIEAVWHFAVPRVDTAQRGERMGRFGTYLYQVAQWYPQVAMYDDVRGWDTDQYLGIGEFYNQFGRFDVRITVPGGWLVGATGTLQNPAAVLSPRTRDRLALAMRVDTTVHVVTADERGAAATAPGASLTWHFTAPLVNDFAFAASRDYVYDATHANIPGREAIPVNVLYLPQHTRYATLNTAQIGRFALEHHSGYVFPYEFAQGTIADGPETGMEYPMIIFDGPGFGVTVHELGHEWFPMTVSSDETRYGWMDEGFNEWIDAAAAADSGHRPINVGTTGAPYRRVAGTELEAPMMWPTDFVGPYATMTTYRKAPLALWALGGVVGDSAVHRAFRAYATAWRFRHPLPYDFFFAMDHALGRNVDWFWHEWFFTTHTFDQGIADVRTGGGRATITVRDRGSMAMPVILRLTLADGSTTTVTQPADAWFGGGRTTVVTVPLGGKTLRQVVLDPENRFQDVDRSDNVWPRG